MENQSTKELASCIMTRGTFHQTIAAPTSSFFRLREVRGSLKCYGDPIVDFPMLVAASREPGVAGFRHVCDNETLDAVKEVQKMMKSIVIDMQDLKNSILRF